MASDRNLVEEQSTVLDNIHALDIVDDGDNANDVERRHSGPVKSFDFSIYDWCIGPHEDFSQNYGQFRQSVGPTTVLPRAATALNFFKLLFSMNIVNRIVVETNKYAQQQYEEAAGKDNLFNWSPRKNSWLSLEYLLLWDFIDFQVFVTTGQLIAYWMYHL